jgi:hypothetical protein
MTADLTLDQEEFDALFDGVIAPALQPYEAERRRLIRGFWRTVILGGMVGVAVAAVIAIVSRDVEGLFDVVLMIGGAVAALAWLPLSRFEKRCKTEALTALAGALKLDYRCDGFEAPNVGVLRDLGLLERWDGATYEDLWTGHLRGSAFTLYEARQTRGSGKNKRTTFSGQIIRIAFPKRFLGTTVVNRDQVRRWKKEGFEKVGLESSEFERIFEVYGTDQVEARFLVHPFFMERLIGVEAATRGRNVRCAFLEGDLLIAIEGGNLFEVVEVFKTVPDREKTRQGVTQLTEIVGLIDAVMAPPPRVYGSPSNAIT